MDGINKIFILGNLGADPELKLLPGGTAVLKLRVATNESWFDKEKNERKERVEWHRVTVFGRRAEGLAKFLRKGMKVFVEGGNRTSSYEKEGQKHYSTEIVADQVLVTGSPRGASDEASTGLSVAPFSPSLDAPSVPSAMNGGYGRVPAAQANADIPF
jgi:single-strand DNA-binding protein